MTELTRYQEAVLRQLAMGPVNIFPVYEGFEEISQLATAGLIKLIDVHQPGEYMTLTDVGRALFEEAGMRMVQ